MDYRVLGKTGLRLSVLSFGCGSVGGLSQTVGPLYARHGCRLDRARLDLAQGVAISRPAVALAIGAMSQRSSGMLVASHEMLQWPPHLVKREQRWCGTRRSGTISFFRTFCPLQIGPFDLSAS
jgi:hypothetical protein